MGWDGECTAFGVYDISSPCYLYGVGLAFGVGGSSVSTSDPFSLQSATLLIRYREYWIRESTTTHKFSMPKCFLPDIQ